MSTKPKKIKLRRGERIVAVVPERFSGPGWGNAPVWVYIGTNDGRLIEECIQPGERTPEMYTLFAAGEAICKALVAAVPTKRDDSAKWPPRREGG